MLHQQQHESEQRVHDQRSHNDQKSLHSEEQQRQYRRSGGEADQDHEDEFADGHPIEDSLQIRGDEPVSELYIWGNDFYGQLGVGSDKVIHNLPKVCSFNIVVTEVSCGEEHTVFIQGDGGYVYSMGSNGEGRLGIGNPDLRSCNVPTLVDGLCNIKKVSCGTSHTLALSEDGQVYAWGQAFYGALGLAKDSQSDQGLEGNVYSPQLIPAEVFNGKPVKDVEAGSRHSIFVTECDKVFGCGDANQGQLGLGDANRDRVIVPTQIREGLTDMSIFKVACGKYHTLFLVDNRREGDRRELWACGANNFGQIGNNSNQNQFRPVRVDPRMPEDKTSQASTRSHRFTHVSAWHASVAVTDEGIMYVWGSGVFGEFKRPRKVKLQNNIRVLSVNIGGTFIVIVDQDKKIVVWGSNSKGEIGVGDSKVRNHPTRLETIEDKTVSQVAVGGSFAFAIGKTTTRLENSIFEDAANRSQLSNIQRNAPSQIGDAPQEVTAVGSDPRNRSMNSLEEQLQQIALHSASKKKQDSCSDVRSNGDKQRTRSQDRSFGNFSRDGQTRFDQAANRVNIHSSQVVQGSALKSGATLAEDSGRVKALESQVESLKQIIEDKDRQISDLNNQAQSKHEDYQTKLQRFKEMQDQELSMSTKLREDNQKLRDECDTLRDEVIQLRSEARDQTVKQRTTSYLAPTRQDSSSTAPPAGQQTNSASGPPPQGHSYSAYDHHLQRGLEGDPNQRQSNDQYLQARGIASYKQQSPNMKVDDLYKPQPSIIANTNTIEFKNTYLREDQPSQKAPASRKDYSPLDRDSTYHQAASSGLQADSSKIKSTYERMYGQSSIHHAPQPPTSQVDANDRSQDSSAKKQKEFQRSYTADHAPNVGDFLRQSQTATDESRGGARDVPSSSHHYRRSSNLKDEKGTAAFHSSYAKRSEDENSASRPPAGAPSYLGRDRINTGRVENLRSMGSELMRPQSRDGGSNAQASNPPTGLTASRTHTDPDSARKMAQMRNSASGFYQLSQPNGYSRDNGADSGLPEPSEIQSRLKNATRYSHGDKSGSEKRSLTPNGSTITQQQTFGQGLPSRVAYKPSYERLDAQQTQSSNYQNDKKDGSGLQGPSEPDRYAPRTDFSAPKDAVLQQRPSSGNSREPFYQTQNNLPKFDKLMSSSEGFSSKFANNNDSIRQNSRLNDQALLGEKPSIGTNDRSSPNMPPPRQDYQADQASAFASRPPTSYKPLDYNTRYSLEPINAAKKDDHLKTFDGTRDTRAPFGNQNSDPVTDSYRMQIDQVKTGGNQGQPSSSTPTYQPRLSETFSSTFAQGRKGNTGFDDLLQGNNSEQEKQRTSIEPTASSNDWSSKPRSPFTMLQSQNEEQPAYPPPAYPRTGDYSYHTSKLNGSSATQEATQYSKPAMATSFTPQGSGRRSGSLTGPEQRPSSATGGGEDIRSKLARYKKEREDFEQIRQQFRKKNAELSSSTTNAPSAIPNAGKPTGANSTAGSLGVGGEIQRSTGGDSYHNDSGKQQKYLGGLHASADGNIFNVDQASVGRGSGTGVQAFAAQVTGGSPAFGQPTYSHSREH